MDGNNWSYRQVSMGLVQATLDGGRYVLTALQAAAWSAFEEASFACQRSWNLIAGRFARSQALLEPTFSFHFCQNIRQFGRKRCMFFVQK